MMNRNIEKEDPLAKRRNGVPLMLISVMVGVVLSSAVVFMLPARWLVAQEVVHQYADDNSSHASNKEFWACPMFCTRSDEPGSCPVCGMTLERFVDTGAQMSLNSDIRQAMSLQTEEVVNRYLAKEIRTVGMFEPDETSEITIAAWVDGRIERMHGGYTGTLVREEQSLIDLYSPALYVAQKELILAKKYFSSITDDSPLYESRSNMLDIARDKIRLLGIPDALIKEIEGWKEPSPTLAIQSRSNGIVIERVVQEGDYVKEGQPLLKIADLHNLWLMLDIYEKDLSWLFLGQKVLVQVDAFSGQQFDGRIGFIYPTLDPKTRTVQVRVEVANKDLALRPGMFGIATILAKLANDGGVACIPLKGNYACATHPLQRNEDPEARCPKCDTVLLESKMVMDKKPGRVLAVPKRAVLSTGSRHLVYVEWWFQRDQNGVMLRDGNGDPIPSDNPEYQGFEVDLGPLASAWKKAPDGKLTKVDDYYPVLGGLPPGIRVVTNAQFLIDSQMELTGKPSLLRAQGGAQTDLHANHRKQQVQADE